MYLRERVELGFASLYPTYVLGAETGSLSQSLWDLLSPSLFSQLISIDRPYGAVATGSGIYSVA
jgi:hypothetical protein